MEQVTENQKSLSFADVFRILRGGIVWIIIITILCLGVGGVYAFALKKTTYTAKLNAQIYVESYTNNQSGDEEYVPEHTRFQYSALLAQKVNMLLTNKDVINGVASEAYGGIKLKGGLSVVPEEEQPFFTVTYTYSQKGGDTKKIKSEVAETLTDYVENAIKYIDDNSDKYPWFTVDSSVLDPNQTVPKSKIIVFSNPQPSDVTASTGKATVLLISLVIGLVLSVIFVFIKNSFDDTVTTKEDIERITKNQVIATIDISHNFADADQKPSDLAKEVK